VSGFPFKKKIALNINDDVMGCIMASSLQDDKGEVRHQMR
jgi:hypothetical protein